MDKTKLDKPSAIENSEFLLEKFSSLFPSKEIFQVKTPLRISPLGAHIDHQLGKLTGMTVDKYIIFFFYPNYERKVKIYSLNYDQMIEFSIDQELKKENKWSDYIKGAYYVLIEKHGKLKYGINGLIYSEIKTGGLSSSAGCGISYLLAIEKVNELNVNKIENVFLMQRIENNFIGLNNGILDQSVILLNDKNPSSLLYIDSKNLSYENILPEKEINFSIIVVHSGIDRVLIKTDYNQRVNECSMAAKILSDNKFSKLRDIEREHFERNKWRLPENLKKRTEHFFQEMERVEKGIKYWKNGDIEKFGNLMKESGKSSIENYESGIQETIELYNILNSMDEIYGARFSGAGFGGSCIGLVKKNIDYEKLENKIKESYLKKFPQYKDKIKIIFCNHGTPPEISKYS